MVAEWLSTAVMVPGRWCGSCGRKCRDRKSQRGRSVPAAVRGSRRSARALSARCYHYIMQSAVSLVRGPIRNSVVDRWRVLRSPRKPNPWAHQNYLLAVLVYNGGHGLKKKTLVCHPYRYDVQKSNVGKHYHGRTKLILCTSLPVKCTNSI